MRLARPLRSLRSSSQRWFVANSRVADLVASVASLGDDEAWAGFEQRALSSCAQWRGEEMVKVLHACTQAQRKPRHLLHRLAKEILEKLPQLDSVELCICLHSFAQLRSRPPSLFQVVTRQLLRQRDLEASHLSSLLYSHVRVLYFDPGLARLVATRIAAEEWRLEDLATSLQALATFGGSLPSLGVELRLSSTSARRVANEMDQMPLPLLGDLLEAFLRLGMPCRTLQEGLAARCLQPELAGLTSDVLLKLLGCVPLEARAACEALGAELAGHIEELDHPRRLVQEKLLKPLGSQIIYFMVDFSSKDVARTAMACQKLMVQDGAVLEALVRQGVRRGFRLKAPQIEAVVAACHAAGFEHPMLVELLEGLQQQKQKQSEKEQAAAAAAAAAPQEGQSDWDSVEEAPMFSEPFESEDLSEDQTGPRSGPRNLSGGASPSSTAASEALHQGRWFQRTWEEAEDEATRTSLLEDKEIRRILHQVDRTVLRPAGLRSRSLAMIRNRRKRACQ
ncbi:unnamed protein product [Durusdinium trenchii]|uniref:Uncharacterized protein n=1 Tax=Durusdinium trenchii TaxID=1381693 RepID=A0ABP0IZ69_9DINO